MLAPRSSNRQWCPLAAIELDEVYNLGARARRDVVDAADFDRASTGIGAVHLHEAIRRSGFTKSPAARCLARLQEPVQTESTAQQPEPDDYVARCWAGNEGGSSFEQVQPKGNIGIFHNPALML